MPNYLTSLLGKLRELVFVVKKIASDLFTFLSFHLLKELSYAFNVPFMALIIDLGLLFVAVIARSSAYKVPLYPITKIKA